MAKPAPESRAQQRENSPWLHRYRKILAPESLILDLGCGTGDDCHELTEHHCRVIALDIQPDRVYRVQHAPRVVANMADGLPFERATFDAVVSSLAIHYFDLETTRAVVVEVARILKPSGFFLCRVNAVGDTNFGYGQGSEVEQDLFRLPDGRAKRFFTADTLERLLQPCFTVEHVEPRTILQHGIEKRTLECLARKR